MFWVHKTCTSIRGRLKQDDKFKCWTGARQQDDTAQECPDIKLNSHSLEVVENFCYLGNTI